MDLGGAGDAAAAARAVAGAAPLRERIAGSLLIEGWRGVNHSFALVNQNQILRLSSVPGLRLFHRDLPFFSSAWSRDANEDGFSAADRRLIDGPADPGATPLDAVYRICSPCRMAPPGLAPARARRALSFVVTELGLSDRHFATEADRLAMLRDDADHLVLTPSAWSFDRLVDYGFAPDRVRVVPHGVDTDRYRRIADPEERRLLRARFAIREDETVFLHVGAPLWTKGIDLLLRAFGVLRARGARARLVVKDQRALYGATVEEMAGAMGLAGPRDAPGATGAEAAEPWITSVPGNLSPEILSALFGVADAYVAPYRAEGFNLPVLEAIACGVPAIATAHGATDDFLDDRLGARLPGRFRRAVGQDGVKAAFVEPDFDALVETMDAVCAGWRPEPVAYETGRAAVLRRFTWDAAADDLLRLAFPAAAASSAAPIDARPVAR